MIAHATDETQLSFIPRDFPRPRGIAKRIDQFLDGRVDFSNHFDEVGGGNQLLSRPFIVCVSKGRD